jgi:uncharacterized protein YndB with AHSA1/START domain
MPTDVVPEVGRRITPDASSSLGVLTGEVLDVDPPRLLRCRWSGIFGDTVVTFELTPVAEGTRLRLEHAGWGSGAAPDRDGFDQGRGDKLAKDLPAVPRACA